MADPQLVDRLAALPNFENVPRAELEWLAAHGTLETREAGEITVRKGEPIQHLWIVLSGLVAIRVDRGAGPRRVMAWRSGDVTGKLPYSRVVGAPGDSYVEEPAELLTVPAGHLPEMIRQCPAFTAHTVHVMVDRARRFSASDLQDEKMVSLGKMAAGLAHELNNPASATMRGAKLLLEGLVETDAAARALGAAGLSAEALATIDDVRRACVAKPRGDVLSPIERADREDRITDWLERHDCDTGHAVPLADTAVSMEALDSLARAASGETLHAALRWIAAGCQTHSLARDIEQAATQIHELVAAVKRFTYMDNLSAPESAEVETGLRDTVRVFASKAKGKGASITIDVETGLPRVRATGVELNQIWSNLLDNALDAIAQGGRIEVAARRELDRVVVSVIDDGPGIPPDVLPRIFDPFYTTKPPGQGTGLGLDITQRLVRRYHGEISVESRPGRTAFRVSLEAEGASLPGSRI
jgi:signal transduction histidine kinase